MQLATPRLLRPIYSESSLADVISRQASALVDKAGLPLGGVAGDDGADLAVGDAEGLGVDELAADEVGVGGQLLAERAEEAPARAVLEEEAGVGGHDEGRVQREHLVDDVVTVAVAGHGARVPALVEVVGGAGRQAGDGLRQLLQVHGVELQRGLDNLTLVRLLRPLCSLLGVVERRGRGDEAGDKSDEEGGLHGGGK